MFDFLPQVCVELRSTMVGIYWTLLVPLCALLIILEFFKMPEGNPNAGLILKRAVVSIILLLSFNETINMIAVVGEGVTDKINGIKNLWDLLKGISNAFEDESMNLFKFREMFIFIISFLSYVVAYLGVFVASVLMHFVWAILYICSPLMILMYVSPSTSFVTKNLYKGLINVMVWKVLWSILAVLLLKLASTPQVGDWDNFLTSILINLCIGVSMLFIPFTTKSLVSDGMTSAASALAAVPTGIAGGAIKNFAMKGAQKVFKRGKNMMGRGKDKAMETAKNQFSRAKEKTQRMLNPRPNIDESNILRPNFKKGRNHDK